MFNKIDSKNINGFEINKYECDPKGKVPLEDLQNIIIEKIKKMKIHKDITELMAYTPPNLKNDFSQTLQKTAAEVASAKENKIIAFHPYRSRVTEFMSQVLLEHEFGCIFSDNFDKRMNLNFHEADKHVSGIDVTGYKKTDNEFKFIICEVKASSAKDIPSHASKGLYDDVKLSVNDNKRVLREIIDVASSINAHDPHYEEVIEFLLSITNDNDSREAIKNKVVIIPFLIRNYNDKMQSFQWDKEFSFYNTDDIKGHEVTGYLWSFNYDIDDFSKDTYTKAIS